MSLFTPYDVGQPTQEEQTAVGQNQFQPSWDESRTRDAIKGYNRDSAFYTETDLNNIRQHASYYNVPFYEGEFDLIDAFKQAGAGFFEGFTTLNLMEPADNEYEQIFRNLGHLSGFAPGLLATPLNAGAKLTKSVALSRLAKTAAALNDKSVPMAGAKFLTKKAKDIVRPALGVATSGKAGAASDALGFLTGNKARHMMEGAFHLGAASAISSWQGGIDQMMHGFVGGATAGGVFRAIGNIALTGSETSQKVVRGLAGSLFMGLPSTARGATTPEQVYEYVMGAYFGKSERPWTQAKAGKFIKKMQERATKDPALRETMDPEMHPEFEALPPEVKPVVKKMATDLWMSPEERLLANSFAAGEINPNKIGEIPAQVEGYEVEQVLGVAGEPTLRPKKGFLSRFITRMASGGSEGADRAWAKSADKLNIPIFNFTFDKHQAQAMLNKGLPRKLEATQLEDANRQVTLSSLSLNRPIENMSQYVLNLVRRNWHTVKDVNTVYAVAPLIRKGAQSMKAVDGGTGWGVDMAIRNNKEVYIFDNSNKARHQGAISNKWYKYNRGLERFEEIQGMPPKPPKTWAGIGSREISKTGEKAIDSFLNKHFEGVEVAPTKAEQKEFKEASERGEVVLKPAIESTKKAIAGVEKSIQLKEKELRDITVGEDIAGRKTKTDERIKIETELSDLTLEVETLEKELEGYVAREDIPLINIRDGKVLDVKSIEGEVNTTDTSPGMRAMAPTTSAVEFVRKHLSSMYTAKSILSPRERETEIASQIVFKLSEFADLSRVDKVNRSKELGEWIKTYAETNNADITLNKEAQGTLRQLMAREVFDKQVNYIGVHDGKVQFLTKRGEEADRQVPYTSSGVSKRNYEPVKLINDKYIEAGGKEESPITILDHVTIKGEKGRNTDMELMRYQEKLERDYRFAGKKPDIAKKLAETDFNKLKANIFKQMNEKGYYLFSGRGDSDRMYFARYNPKTEEAFKSGLFKEILTLGKMGKEASRMSSRFVNAYKGKSGLNEKTLRVIHDKGYMSNLLYDMQMNGFDISTPKAIRASAKLMFSGKGDFISSSKAFNKRSQIWLNNGYSGDPAFIKNYKTEKGNKVKLTTDGKARYILVEDLPKAIRDKMDKDPLYSSDVTRKSTELGEHIDGAIIAEGRTLRAVNADAGMPEHHVQNKSFIVSPDAQKGALLGKYMMHDAGPAMSKFMRDKGINFIVQSSAAKQIGLRNKGDYKVTKAKGLDLLGSEIYDLDLSHIKYNYSVKTDSHMAKWTRAVKQMLGALSDNTQVPFKKETISNMLSRLLDNRFEGDVTANDAYFNYLKLDANGKSQKINSIIKNIENIGIEHIVDGIRRPGNELFAERVYDYMLTKNKEVMEADYNAGEISEVEYRNAMFEINAENSTYRKKLAIAKQWKKLNPKDSKSSIDAIYFDKDVRNYRMQVIKNFIVREATRPRMANSAIARMRPYDKAMQIDLDNANPRLKELDKNDKIFFLDNGYKTMKIDTGIEGYGKNGIITLEQLWNGRKGTYKDIAPEIFKTLALRVPMDSVSGAHGLTFRGFTGREGYGTLLHSRVMRALGGADLDGDEAHIYFGGEKKGFKKAWREGFEANKEEFYYHVDKNGMIVDKPVKGGRTLVGDNKQAVIPVALRKDLKLPADITTYQDLLTTTKEFTKDERSLLNSRGAMYSIHERNRISESASRGRAQMGSSAVVPKQMMAQIHSMLGGGKDAKPTKDEFTIKRRGEWNNNLGKYNWKEYKLILSPKTDPKWRKLAQEIGRAQIAFSSDPMDELGLKSAEAWFKLLHNAHFNVQIINKKTGKKASYADLNYNDLTSWDLKKGLYGTLNDLNKAYWGRNYKEGRRYSVDEMRTMSEGIYGLMNNQRNNFLVKVGEKLNPLDWSDNAIGRMDKTAVLDMYKRINKEMADPKYNFLKDLLGRSSFAVPESKHLLQSIYAVDKSQRIWNSTTGKHEDVTFNLWDASQRREIAQDPFRFKEAVGKIKIAKELMDATKKGTEEARATARERILADIAYKAEDYFINDINDMATFKIITDLANKMTKEQLQVVPAMHKFVEKLKSRSYLLAKERNKLGGFDWNSMSPESVKEVKKWMKDSNLKELIPNEWKTIKEKASSTLDRAKIDIEIRKFRKENNLDTQQAEMLDNLLLGTYKRGNLSKINELSETLTKNDPLVRDMLSHLRSMAAETQMSKLGWNSEALSSGKAQLNMVGAMSRLFSQTWKAPEKSQIEAAQKFANELPNKIKEEEGVDYFEEAVQGIDYTTGYEGLKKGVEINDIPKDIRSEMSQFVSYVKNENNKFQTNLNEAIRSLLGKDLNVLNKQDYQVLNNWFRDVKAGTIWQRIWGKKSPTELAKRHHWLFPRTVNRELMRDDIELMEEKGLYLTKGGKVITGKLMRPTQHIDMVQSWIARTTDSATRVAEEEIQGLKEQLLFINSIKDGETLRQIAVREREFKYWDNLKFLSRKDRINSAEYKERYNDIIKNHGDKLDKEYTVELDGKRNNYTGRELVERVNKEYTKFFEKMHNFIRGEENWLDKNKMIIGYYGKTDRKSPKIDHDKFTRYLLEAWRNGENLTTKIGIDGLRQVARSMMIEMAKNSPEYAEVLKSQPIEPTGKWGGSFDYYFPHMHFNKKLAGKGMNKLMKKIYEMPLSEFDADPKKAKAKREKEIKGIIYKNHTLTGDWQLEAAEDFINHDKIMADIAESRAKKKQKVKWPIDLTKAGNMSSRVSHIPGWSVDPTVPEAYTRALVNTYHKQMAQIFSRNIMEQMYRKMLPKWGEKQAQAWQKFMQLYVQDAIGNPTVIPERYLNDPTLKLRGTPYAWWADSNVEKRINKIRESFGLGDKSLPKELRGVDMQQVRHWSNLEAQFEMAALLAHPKSMVTNVFGGTMHTVESAGWKNWRNSRNISWLKQNINSKWNSMEDVTQFVIESGVYPEYMLYEAGLSKEIRQGKNREFIEDVAKKMAKTPEMSNTTLKEIAKQYGVKDKVVQFAAKFMTVPEKMIRRDAFMSHYIQAWERYGGAIKDPNNQFLIEQAKKGVQATQFLYSAPFRPAFARTALGKVMTRFQLWSWNAVRFRNDVYRQAKIYGLTPGTEAFERYTRMMQIDIFTFALANMFAYSLFETALPAPWNWMQDTADWIFGNEKERDRAFFGQWPKQLAPLQMVTPPILRLLPSSMRAMVDDDWSKVGKYYVWTMFPFGRMARDLVGPGNLIENPIRIMEKTTGFPLLQLQKKGTELASELEEGERELSPTPGGSLLPF